MPPKNQEKVEKKKKNKWNQNIASKVTDINPNRITKHGLNMTARRNYETGFFMRINNRILT